MKIHHARLGSLALLLFLIAGFAAQANGQGYVRKQLNDSPKLRGRAAKNHKSNAADGVTDYTFSVLYSFCLTCGDGQYPFSGLIADSVGNVYGTTTAGGFWLDGTVFEVDATGHETALYDFCSLEFCLDGNSTFAGVIQDATGNLYGTTYLGGPNGFGTVFKLSTPLVSGTETVLYSFCPGQGASGCTDGFLPVAGLILDPEGNLYGTTPGGGANSNPNCPSTFNLFHCGVVFKLDTAGNETVLYNFCSAPNCSDGAAPYAGLIRDAAGNFYGTTSGGGASGGGTVFKLDETGHETVLYSFCSAPGCADGENPQAGLIQDAAGNLYGTTVAGGNSDSGCLPGSQSGTCGTVFKVDTTGQETVLYSFCPAAGCADGASPVSALVQDAAGDLFGTTQFGGTTLPGFAYGGGTVFALDNAGHYSVLHSFCSSSAYCADGSRPEAGLVQDVAGNLYGTTQDGGATPGAGVGTVFKLAVPGFTVSGTAVSVSPGAPTGNTSAITVTSVGGFAGGVALTATITSSPSGAQDPPTLSFGSTSPVSITGTTAGTATLTISTTAATNAALAYPVSPGARRYNAGGAATFAFVLLVGIGIPARRSSWRARLGLLVFLAILTASFFACSSSGGGGGGSGNPGTTPGTYTVTVTGTSGSTTATGTVTLTVQ